MLKKYYYQMAILAVYFICYYSFSSFKRSTDLYFNSLILLIFFVLLDFISPLILNVCKVSVERNYWRNFICFNKIIDLSKQPARLESNSALFLLSFNYTITVFALIPFNGLIGLVLKSYLKPDTYHDLFVFTDISNGMMDLIMFRQTGLLVTLLFQFIFMFAILKISKKLDFSIILSAAIFSLLNINLPLIVASFILSLSLLYTLTDERYRGKPAILFPLIINAVVSQIPAIFIIKTLAILFKILKGF